MVGSELVRPAGAGVSAAQTAERGGFACWGPVMTFRVLVVQTLDTPSQDRTV